MLPHIAGLTSLCAPRQRDATSRTKRTIGKLVFFVTMKWLYQ